MINSPPCHHLSKPAMIYWFLYLSHKKKRTLPLSPSFTLSLCQFANTNQQWANCCLMWKREFLSWSIGEDSKIYSKPNASLCPLYHILCLFFYPCTSQFLQTFFFILLIFAYALFYHMYYFNRCNSLYWFSCLFVLIGGKKWLDLMSQATRWAHGLLKLICTINDMMFHDYYCHT